MRKTVFTVFLLLALILWNSPLRQETKEINIPSPSREMLNVQIEGLSNAGKNKLVFLQHGLAADREHQIITTLRRVFLDNGYVVVSFDSRHSLGKSGRQVEKARLSTFVEDLSTVIDWASEQNFYSEPFIVAGHSLGGASVLSYSAAHPRRVKKLIAVAPVVSGRLWEKSCLNNMPDFCRSWQTDGFYAYQAPNGGPQVNISYRTLEEAKSFDALTLAPGISAVPLLIAAVDDRVIPPADVQKLYDRFSRPKYITVIKNCEHNFTSRRNRKDLSAAVKTFILMSVKTKNPDEAGV